MICIYFYFFEFFFPPLSKKTKSLDWSEFEVYQVISKRVQWKIDLTVVVVFVVRLFVVGNGESEFPLWLKILEILYLLELLKLYNLLKNIKQLFINDVEKLFQCRLIVYTGQIFAYILAVTAAVKIIESSENGSGFIDFYLVCLSELLGNQYSDAGEAWELDRLQKFMLLLMRIIGVAYFGYELIQITNYRQLSRKVNKMIQLRESFQQMLNQNGVCRSEQMALRKDFEDEMKKINWFSENLKRNLLDELPLGLRRKLLIKCYLPVLRKLNFLRGNFSLPFMQDLCQSVEEFEFLQNMNLNELLNLEDSLCFLESGSLKFFLKTESNSLNYLGKIPQNSQFNQMSFFESIKRRQTYIYESTEKCKIYVIRK